jgi:hypothetical protein
MLKIKLHSIYKVFFFLFLFTVVSRGFFELYFDKKIAFLIQVLGILTFIVISLLFFKVKLELKYFSLQLRLFTVFFISALLSIIITISLNNGGAPFFYSGVMFFLAVSLIFISSFNFNKFRILNIGKMILLLILILFSVGLYEQLTDTLMPGAWWYENKVRPASLTGSKQHYSIILSILTLFIFQYWLILKDKKYLFGFIIGVAGVLLSLSRSGAMILVLAFFPFIFYKIYFIYLIKVSLKWLVFSIFFLIIIIISSLLFFDLGFFLERTLSSLDTKSAGNGQRIEAWIKGLNMISSSNILFGEYTGVVTNSTRTITKTDSFVVESGTLQMIINFGIIGFLAFYSILFILYSRINKNTYFLLLTLFSCLISTIVYQSIETIPFIILLSLIPSISNDINIIKSYKN